MSWAMAYLVGKDTRWCLEFTGSMWIDIISQDDEVKWQLTQESPAFEHDSNPYSLRWPSGETSLINPAKLFADRVGTRFWQLWVNDLGLYVYLHRKLILCFHSLRHVEDGSCVLSVFEDD